MWNPKAKLEAKNPRTADCMTLKDSEEKKLPHRPRLLCEKVVNSEEIPQGLKLLEMGVLFVTANQGMEATVHALTPCSMGRQRPCIPADFPVSLYGTTSLLLL